MTINWKTVAWIGLLAIALPVVLYAILKVFVLRLDEKLRVLPVLVAFCTTGDSDNPDVPQSHPQVIFNHTGFPFPHWVEIVVRDESGATLYRVVYSGPNETGRTVFDGEFSDISSRATHVFSPDAGYTVRVWNHPYEDGAPQFEERDLAYENWFSVPVCR